MLDLSRLKDLAEKMPKLQASRSGDFTLSADGREFHSKYDPRKEAVRAVSILSGNDPEKTIVVFLGTGIGYAVEEAEKRGFRHLIVIEQNETASKIFSRVYDLPKESVFLSAGEDIAKMDSVFASFPAGKDFRVKTVTLRGAYQKEHYEIFEERIRRLMQVHLGDFATRLKFEENWFINILKNSLHLEGAYPGRLLFGAAKNRPVIIVSAGPSLAGSLSWLKKVQDFAVLLAVDTAALPLWEAGIVPDFVYSLDSQVHNLNDFALLPQEFFEETALICDMVVHPALPLLFQNRFFVNTAHLEKDTSGKTLSVKNELVSRIEKILGFSFGDIETGGSVATSAFHFAYLLGASEIVLTGQDLAYSGRCSHATSTPHYYRILNMTSRAKTLESIFLWVMGSRELVTLPSLSGGEIESDFVLNNYKGWFEESAKNLLRSDHSVTLLNQTVEGALLSGFRRIDFEKVLKNLRVDKKITKNSFSKFPKFTSNMLYLIQEEYNSLLEFINSLPEDSSVFSRIENSKFGYLLRYFLREKAMFERYGNFEDFHFHRKKRRLQKNISGVQGAKRCD